MKFFFLPKITFVFPFPNLSIQLPARCWGLFAQFIYDTYLWRTVRFKTAERQNHFAVITCRVACYKRKAEIIGLRFYFSLTGKFAIVLGDTSRGWILPASIVKKNDDFRVKRQFLLTTSFIQVWICYSSLLNDKVYGTCLRLCGGNHTTVILFGAVVVEAHSAYATLRLSKRFKHRRNGVFGSSLPHFLTCWTSDRRQSVIWMNMF